LSRIAEFRKRLEAMPRLTPGAEPEPTVAAKPSVATDAIESGSRTQAMLASSLQKLGETSVSTPPALSNRARRLLTDAHGLVARLRALVDEPLLAGPPHQSASSEDADPLAVHFRETAALAEAAVRYAVTFPEVPSEQARLCEGLEGMIDAARRRFDLMTAAVEGRRIDESRIDRLARFLVAMDSSNGPVAPAAIDALADELLGEGPGRPLRFLTAEPVSKQAYLGGPSYPAPSRFVACHGLNCATVLARVVRSNRTWQDRAHEIVLAGLIHDVGMLRVPVAALGKPGSWDVAERKEMQDHARAGAERIMTALPGMSAMAEAVEQHHERLDGTGYPRSIAGEQLSPLARLLSVADVYAALCAPRPHRLAHDPRAALTDVMLLMEEGKLDRYAAETLLGLGLYPAGTVVELADGTTAVVLAPHDPRVAVHNAAKPMVAMLTDGEGHAFPSPRFVDLASASNRSVVRTLTPMDRLKRLGRSYPEWV
jgi:hypothetical protein